MPTLRDVARASGVSISTVSHVINNRTSKVRPETRARVLSAVRELRYRPTVLRVNRQGVPTHTVGILSGDLTAPIFANDYFMRLFDGALEEAALREHSLTVFVEALWVDAGECVRRHFDCGCDGVMLVAPTSDSASLRLLWDRGVPIVAIGSAVPWPNISVVDIDNESAGFEATRHLLGLGHRYVAYIGASRSTYSSGERYEGYRRAMQSMGAQREQICAVFAMSASSFEADRSPKAPRRSDLREDRSFERAGWGPDLAVFVLTHAMPRCTAFVCWNDDLARSVIDTVQSRGLTVPTDLSVVSFDDTESAEHGEPGLTTLRQPLKLIGQTALDVLVDRIVDPALPDQTVRFTAELIVRGSSAPPRVIYP